MNFTSDWVTPNIPNFEKCMANLPVRKNFLEIGCFEGRATCWLLQNGLEVGGSMVCVDTFSPEWYTGENLRKVFDDNVREARQLNQVISVYEMKSPLALAQLISAKQTYDFIYIDGDHSPAGVITDATMAWQLLNRGGVMLFDDYEYDKEPTKCGIDGFLMGFVEQYDLVLKNYQLAVKKK
jgi:predicted O-methyltransferase YrrM